MKSVEAVEKVYEDSDQLSKEGYTATNVAFLNQFVDTAHRMQVQTTDTLNMIHAGTTDVENELTGHVTTEGRNYPMGRFKSNLDILINDYNQSIQKV